MQNNKLVIAALMVLLFSSCNILLRKLPPYIITKPFCEISGNSSNYSYAGIKFNFHNKGEKTISRITVSFALFDAKTKNNPFTGSNVFEITKSELIMPDAHTSVVLTLDPYIYAAPAEPYLIDYFYISEIRYTDGSVWNDKYGIYNQGI